MTVHPLQETAPDGFLAGNAGRGSDRMDIFLTASPDGSQMLLISQFDNLGKGSSGAAVQCMNIMLGLAGGRRAWNNKIGKNEEGRISYVYRSTGRRLCSQRLFGQRGATAAFAPTTRKRTWR